MFGEHAIAAVVGASRTNIYTHPNAAISALKQQGYEVHAVTRHGTDVIIPLDETNTEVFPTQITFPRDLDFAILYFTPTIPLPEDIGIIIPPQTDVQVDEHGRKVLRECPIASLELSPHKFGVGIHRE
tara:strand:+ start:564 stop:947 length:384 start_codon:yes stop_codon:yes gene_type:complete